MVFLGATARQTDETTPGRWLVVTAPTLPAELTPLIEHRRAEGFQVTVLESTALLTPEPIQQTNAMPLRSHIRNFAMQPNSPCYVLLAGLPANPDPATAERNVVPALFGIVERMKGQLTDSMLAPVPKPGLLAVAVGRFPARTILAPDWWPFESPFGDWAIPLQPLATGLFRFVFISVYSWLN